MKSETSSAPHKQIATVALLWVCTIAAIAAAVLAISLLTSSNVSAAGGDNNAENSQTAPELPDSDNLDFAGVGG